MSVAVSPDGRVVCVEKSVMRVSLASAKSGRPPSKPDASMPEAMLEKDPTSSESAEPSVPRFAAMSARSRSRPPRSVPVGPRGERARSRSWLRRLPRETDRGSLPPRSAERPPPDSVPAVSALRTAPSVRRRGLRSSDSVSAATESPSGPPGRLASRPLIARESGPEAAPDLSVPPATPAPSMTKPSLPSDRDCSAMREPEALPARFRASPAISNSSPVRPSSMERRIRSD